MADINVLRKMLAARLITEADLSGMSMSGSADPPMEAPMQQNALAQMVQPTEQEQFAAMAGQRQYDPATMREERLPMNSMRNNETGKMTYFNPANSAQSGSSDSPYGAGAQPTGSMQQEQRLGQAVEVPGRGMGRYSADQRSVVFPDGSRHDLFPRASAAQSKYAFEQEKAMQGLLKGEADIAQTREQIQSARTTREQGKQVKPVFNAEMGAWMYPPDASNPNGRIVTPDGQQRPMKLTEFQGKASAFGQRAAESHEVLNAVGQDGKVQPGMIKRMAEGLPGLGFGANEAAGNAVNWTQSAPQQQVEQAQRNFINATLRQESGAVISPNEFDNARKQYFPQPGDTPEVIAQKKMNRETIINSFADSAGPAKEKVTGATGKARERFDTIKAAQDAIKRGAPPDAVKKRLEAAGITGHGL